MRLAELDPRTLEAIAAYDAHAREYQQTLRHRRPTGDLQRFRAWLTRGDLVLDIGCGPASDLRALRDLGVHPVGIDLSMGALREARLLLPRHPLVRTSMNDLPFEGRPFGGLWMAGAFNHLPRGQWRDTFAHLLGFVSRGPVYLSCVKGSGDMELVEDPVLGTIPRSDALEEELEALFTSHGLRDVTVELRPDPYVDHARPWVTALGHVA